MLAEIYILRRFPSLLTEETAEANWRLFPAWRFGRAKAYFAIVNACYSACRHWRSIEGDSTEDEWLWLCVGAAWQTSYRPNDWSTFVRWLHSAHHPRACEQSFCRWVGSISIGCQISRPSMALHEGWPDLPPRCSAICCTGCQLDSTWSG